jgi:hypothetical protein
VSAPLVQTFFVVFNLITGMVLMNIVVAVLLGCVCVLWEVQTMVILAKRSC